MITRVLCTVAIITIGVMGYTAYLDRNLEVIEAAKIPLSIKAVPSPNQEYITSDRQIDETPSLHWRGGIKISSPHKTLWRFVWFGNLV